MRDTENTVTITYTHYDETITIENRAASHHIEEFYGMCKQLAHAAGFASARIEEWFDNEG